MLSRSSVACWSRLWDPLITETVWAKGWHMATPLPPSALLSFLSFVSVALRLQSSADVMPCSWARSRPVEASSKENCFMKASRASKKGQKSKQNHSSVRHRFYFFSPRWGYYLLRSSRLETLNTLLSFAESGLTFILILCLSVCSQSGEAEINTQFHPHFLQSHFVVRVVSLLECN